MGTKMSHAENRVRGEKRQSKSRKRPDDDTTKHDGTRSGGDVELTYLEHLSELRKRIIISFLAVVVGAGTAYVFVEELVSHFLTTAGSLEFVYLSPPELFLTYLKISVILGLMAMAPVVLYQLWVFVRPALSGRERLYFLLSLIFGTLFFYVGVFFAFTVILPITIEFFLKYATGEIRPMFSIGSFVGFQLTIMVAFGASFELPMLVLALTKVGLIGPEILKKYRTFALLLILILAAILTPPDVISQILLGGPMYALFELSILVSSVLAKKERERALEMEDDDGEDDDGDPTAAHDRGADETSV
jgi:sec-independent protein translocase protein TatC